MNETIEKWLKQAIHDFESAKKNFEINIYDVTLILCEQAVEKILKAYYYLKYEKAPPKVHSLEKLTELLGLEEELNELIIELDDFYFTLRYPDVAEEVPYELCDREDALLGLKKTEKIIELIKSKISEKK
jgi:HEPN domain-containing protein